MLPRTRFPFFSGDYTEKFLHEAVLELKSGLSRMFSDSDIGLPVIRSNNIKDYCLDFNDLKYWFDEDTQGAKTSNYHLRDGDILVNFINSQAQIGKSAIYQNVLKRDCIYTTNILSLRINKEYSSRFIFFFFQTKKYNDFIQSITKPAVNQASFTTKDFRKMKIFFPNFTEQTKIADFLSSVDEKITLLNKQYELLCQYKKGMMQKIFSQEFRLKDKDGKDFPKWDNKRMGSLISEYKCKTTKENEWPVMTSSRSGLVLQREYYGENRLTERSNIGFNIIPCDYLTYRSRSDDGLFFFNQNKLNITGCISVYYPVFKFKYGNNYFYTTMFNYYKNLFRAYAVGSSQLVLSITDLKEMKFLIPSPDEQMKISEFISAIDKRIDAAKSTLEKLKTWKQGLLQQMFV